MERARHAGNLTAAFAVIATTADITLARGAATMFGAALSGSARFKKPNRTVKLAAKEIATDLDAAISRTHLSKDQQIRSRHMVRADLRQLAALAKGGDYTCASAEIDIALEQTETQMGRYQCSQQYADHPRQARKQNHMAKRGVERRASMMR